MQLENESGWTKRLKKVLWLLLLLLMAVSGFRQTQTSLREHLLMDFGWRSGSAHKFDFKDWRTHCIVYHRQQHESLFFTSILSTSLSPFCLNETRKACTCILPIEIVQNLFGLIVICPISIEFYPKRQRKHFSG